MFINSNAQFTTPDSCGANFAVTTTPGAVALSKTFTALPAHNHFKKPTKICWTFGDGTDSCILYTPNVTNYSINHTYANYATYTVCVKIYYDGGCIADKCNPVAVLNPTPPPTPDSCGANFVASPQLNPANPLAKTFTPTPIHNHLKKPTKICWTFGDGTDSCVLYNSTASNYNINHTYTNYATYTVCVKIYYDGGCIADKCNPVAVLNPTPPPTPDSCGANFVVTQLTATNFLNKTFTALPSHNHYKKPTQICWTFGDGTPDSCITYTPNATNYTINHTFANYGTYTVCVKITYDGGCFSYKCNPVVVLNPIPPPTPDTCAANFVVVGTGTNSGLNKYFNALPQHNNNKKPTKICWTFGDGADTCINYTTLLTQYPVYHHYNNYGTYTVCVKIYYDGGCIADKCNPVVVLNPTPPPTPDSCKANFVLLNTPTSGILNRYFNALPYHNHGKIPTKICWTFGDGTDTCITYTTAQPQYPVYHHYNNFGTYTVCVKIYYDGGCIADKCNAYVFTPNTAPCEANFTDSMMSAFKVKYKGNSSSNSTNPVTAWQWTFGDGTTATGQNVIHEYAAPGNYTVCLKITTANGCQFTRCKQKIITANTIQILHLAPNPVHTVLYVTYYSFANELAQVKIFNTYGVLVKSFTRYMNIGYNNFSTDCSTLPIGIYSLVIQTPTTLVSGAFYKN